MHNIKIFQLFALVCLVFGLVFVTSCKKDDGDDTKTDKELAMEALTTGSWSIVEASSSAGQGVTVADITIAISGTETITATFGGGLETYVSDATFSVTEAGGVSAPTLTVVPTDYAIVGTPTASLSGDNMTLNITFELEQSTARAFGSGTYDLTFVKEAQ